MADYMENAPAVRTPVVDTGLLTRLRNQEAVKLKALQWSLTDICRQLGYPTESEAYYGIQQGMADAVRFAKDEDHHLELVGLAELELRLWKMLDENMPMVNHGQVVKIDGEPVQDLRFQLDVADRILKVKVQRAKLSGLFAPTRTEVITLDMIEAEISRLKTEVSKNTGYSPTATTD
jgi:hypothetical protein